MDMEDCLATKEIFIQGLERGVAIEAAIEAARRIRKDARLLSGLY